MKLTFLGAAGEVTGSAYLIETSRARVLLDYGLFQGGREADRRNRAPMAFDASRLDAVVLTHAHVDHLGRLPLLRRAGYRGAVHATPATCELAAIMLRDSASLQEQDALYETRRNQRRGRPAVEPLYTRADAEAVIPAFAGVAYDQRKEVAPGISIRLVDAGHIIGSASVEMTIEEGGARKVVVFSGDIGVRGVPIMHDPTTLPHADVVVMESTYGDRDHRDMAGTLKEFASIIQAAVWDKERVLIPAFAVGRTQALLYYLLHVGRTSNLPAFNVHIDSPMAVDATELYRKHRAILDEQGRDALHHAERNRGNPTFVFVEQAEDSKRLNEQGGAGVIIAGSGMCTGGRILHHLKHNLWKRGVHLMIVGYQGVGTLGRRLVDGEKLVRIYGEWIAVRAEVHTLGGFSAHAGQSDLVHWAGAWAKDQPRVFLTHGEERGRVPLKERLGRELGLSSIACPMLGESVTL